MSKLTYWKLPSATGGDEFAYSERFERRKDAYAFWDDLERSKYANPYQACEVRNAPNGESYRKPVKVTIAYQGGTFGLLKAIAGEDHNDF